MDRVGEENLKKRALDTAFFERRPRLISSQFKKPEPISPTTQRRWDLAARAVELYPILSELYVGFAHDEGRCLHLAPTELLACRIQNWPYDDLLRNVGGLTVGMILWLSNLIYGGLHALAWNEHFPTLAERWLWRVSAVYIGFCGGLWIVLNWIAQAYKPLNEFWEGWMKGKKTILHNLVLGALVFLCGSALGLARAFIVLESFLSIRELPKAAYQTPTWSQVLPHF